MCHLMKMNPIQEHDYKLKFLLHYTDFYNLSIIWNSGTQKEIFLFLKCSLNKMAWNQGSSRNKYERYLYGED